MKYINPEKSCILDVGTSRADELERAGWKPYIEPVIKTTTAPKQAKGATNKGKKK